MKFLFLIIPIFFIETCLSPNSSIGQKSFNFGDTLTIKFQETVFDKEKNFSIKFDSLLGDSRCPINAICWWEGNAKILLVIEKDSNRNNIILNTYKPFGSDTTIFGYSINLIDVWPKPHSDSLYSEEDYSIDLLILKE